MTSKDETSSKKPERLAKVMARSGVCSRREAERWIADGRVRVNEVSIDTPATLVVPTDLIEIDGRLLPKKEETRLWIFHKPRGIVTTHFDPEGRETLFDLLPRHLPDHVISVGRLDLMSEGLILLTNDGELARKLEHPSSEIPRIYQVRIFGKLDPRGLDQLAKGITVNGVDYGPIQWRPGPQKGDNQWLEMTLTEGKNREIRKVVDHIGGRVNRLIRVAYGPFKLGGLESGTLKEIPSSDLASLLQ
ncbi:MAG TPA: pseudouridine synthase [Holosporales bacterium]|nr:pseudouridine synthase [Holosporales bacterium]